MSALSRPLAEYAAGYGVRVFDWKTANCCHFAAGWVLASTGHDPMAGLPQTEDKFAAYRLIRNGGGLAGLWSRQLGREPIRPTLAQVGDVVLMPLDDDRAAVGICAGRTAMFIDENGATAHQPMALATHAWRLKGNEC